MNDFDIRNNNRKYWDETADQWFGSTALPLYGMNCPTEDDLHLLPDLTCKTVLDVCCGSGHSLLYTAKNGASELWGLDLSEKQLNNAGKLLSESGINATLVCSPMEVGAGIPTDHFDVVYSIFGIGWTTDLEATFRNINLYLKKGGTFVFSWVHPLNYCVAWSREDRKIVFEGTYPEMRHSYLDESYFTMPDDGRKIVLKNRKLSTYLNALAESGFTIERLIEETDEKTLGNPDRSDNKTRKARMLPLSFIVKARKNK